MENSSGQGKTAVVPPEISGWNWGAFLLNWIWGIGNNTFIALLMFVPFVNLVMAFILGAKGSVWAWRNKQWQSVEHFKSVQRKWALWAIAVYLLAIAAFVGLYFGIAAGMKSSDAFKLAESSLQSSQEAADILGQPISTGSPSGSVSTSGTGGNADLTFGVQGPKGKGTVYYSAVKELGEWKVNKFILEEADSGKRTDLNE